MGRFLSFRVAPGIRLSASSRGLRAHVGPRFARIHVGGGRPGVSTGAGPLTVYESLGGSSSRRASPRTGSMTPAQAQKLREVEQARAAFARLSALHRAEFVAPVRPVAPAVALAKFGTLLAAAEKQELRGLGLFDRAGRKAARTRARVVAEGWARDLLTLAERDRRARQAQIDAHWTALAANDPAAVRAVLAEAFAGANPPVRVAGTFGSEVGLVVTLPASEAVVPARKPALTPSDAPTLHQMTKTERNEWYAQVLASHLLLAVKKALVHAPAATGVRAVAVGEVGRPLVAARVERSLLLCADWRQAAWPVLAGASSVLCFDARGRTRELAALDLHGDEVFGPLLVPGP